MFSYIYSKKYLLLAIITIPLTVIYPQTYSLNVWGITIGEVTMDLSQSGLIEVKTQSSGIIDYFWPFKNTYSTHFDTLNYSLRKYEKHIKQGEFKQKLEGRWEPSDSTFHYNDSAIKRSPNTQNIFALLVRILNQDSDQFDTRWFSIEHEGSLYDARLLWNEHPELPINPLAILGGHVRLDLRLIEKGTLPMEKTDFFSQYIVHPNAVRQIWLGVDNNKRIVRTSVKLKGIKIEANLKI